MKQVLFFLIFLSACSHILPQGSPKEGKQNFGYVDGSGRYGYTREQKLINKTKLITRTQISSTQGSAVKPLEKSIMVSQLGSVNFKGRRAMVMRPFASEFTVWLEGKKYSSKMRLDSKTKSMLIDLDSPEAKWQGRQAISVPKGKQFCFFSQIPDCLYHNTMLSRTRENKGERLDFYVVWDGYPFIQEQLTGVGAKLFSPAVVKYDGEVKKLHRYSVEVDGQTVLYHFSKSYDLVRMFWIAQGITILPPNEEIAVDEE